VDVAGQSHLIVRFSESAPRQVRQCFLSAPYSSPGIAWKSDGNRALDVRSFTPLPPRESHPAAIRRGFRSRQGSNPAALAKIDMMNGAVHDRSM
jgi:hypothetical protein